MPRLLFLLALVLGLLPTRADNLFILDNFSQSSNALTADFTNTHPSTTATYITLAPFSVPFVDFEGRQIQVQRTLSAEIHNNFDILGTAISRSQSQWGILADVSSRQPYSAQLEYSHFGGASQTIDLSTMPFLQVQVRDVTFTPTLTIQLKDASGDTLNGSYLFSPVSSTTILSFDLQDTSLFTATSGFQLSDVSDILIGLEGADFSTTSHFGEFAFTSTAAQSIAAPAVPEPSSYALALIATLVLLAAAHGHARKKAACSQPKPASTFGPLRQI